MNQEHGGVSRRHLLATVAGLTTGAGCSAIPNQSSITQVHLGMLTLANWSSKNVQ